MVEINFHKQPISLAHQVLEMRKYFPNLKASWHKNVVRWVGVLQPGALTQRYRIQITHQLHRNPEVVVLNPKLVADATGKIPHTYPGRRLCLFHPDKQEWNQQKYIATTIVPWTSLWLTYYELWRVTGDWLGGGEHPEPRAARRSTMQIIADLS